MTAISLMSILFALNASSAGEVTVRLYSIFHPSQVQMNAATGKKLKITLVTEDGKRRNVHAESVQVKCAGRFPVCLLSGKSRECAAQIEIRPAAGAESIFVAVPRGPSREYAGWVVVSEFSGECLIVNQVPLDEYAQSVACHEIRGAGQEALKAQVVASRTYALAGIAKHEGDGYDFCDLTHCQVYTGREACTLRQHKVLDEVKGLALIWEDRPAETYYFSTCGGHTASASDAWGPKATRAYLPGVRDGESPFCGRSEHMRWRFDVDREVLCENLREKLPRLGKAAKGESCSLTIERTGTGGWVSQVAVGGKATIHLTGDRFHMLMGRLFGWNRFKSARFTLESRGAKLVFHGRGLGHGVGMCQHGAMGMEKEGADFIEILEHYFPGTRLEKWP